jgi:small-conductance mechanosensitive channel
MNVVPLLEQLWPGLRTPLLEGVDWLSAGSLSVLLLWALIGTFFGQFIARRLIRFEAQQGVLDPQIHYISQISCRIIMFTLCMVLGLDMAGIFSVIESMGFILTQLDSILGYVLFYRVDVPIKVGGVLSVGVCFWAGRKLAPRFSAILLRTIKERGVEDPRIHQIIERCASGIIILACIGLGLDIGQIVTMTESVSSFFSLFTSPMFKIGEHDITVSTLATLGAIVAGTFYVSRIARSTLRPALLLRLDQPSDSGTISVIERLTHYAIVAIGIIVALQTAGIDLSALLATGAAFAVGLSLAMQSMAQNFISGLILLLERAIKPGDILELDGEPVRVIRIGIRSTVVKTLNDEDRIVPNASLVENAITNYSYSNQHLRIRATVGVAYESDLRQVMASLERAAKRVDSLPEFEPRIMIQGFGASSVDFEISIWIRDPWGLHQAASDLRMAIWEVLSEDEIVIAYPQLDVHFDQEAPGALTLLAGGEPGPVTGA